MYIVDSGASLHMMGLSSLSEKEKKTIRQSSKILDIQTANDIVLSDTQAKGLHNNYLWVHLVEDSPSVLSMGRLCHEIG